MKLDTQSTATFNNLGYQEREQLIRLIDEYKTHTGSKELSTKTFPLKMEKHDNGILFLLNIKNIIELNLDGNEKLCTFAEETLNITQHIANVNDGLVQS